MTCTLALWVAGAATGAILHTGKFLDEVKARTGQQWVGLYREDGEWAVRWTPIRVVSRDSTRVIAAGPVQPVMLVRGLNLRDGALVETSYYRANPTPFRGNERIETKLGEMQYVISVISKDPVTGIYGGADLRLAQGSVTQTIYSLPNGGNDPVWRILWMGDLDGDGKLDIYADLGGHYAASERILFLSTMANPGALVGVFATLLSSRC
jgi:hypothetical protein